MRIWHCRTGSSPAPSRMRLKTTTDLMVKGKRTEMTASRKALNSHRRIVIKIGSALLVDRKTGLKIPLA